MTSSPEARQRPPDLSFRLALAIFVLTLALGGLVGVGLPGIRTELVREDGLVESACALAFLVGGVLGLWHARRPGPRRPLLLLLGLFGLVCGLDELSWGERAFQMAMPVVAGVKLDAVHDMLDLVLATVPAWASTHPGLAAAAAVPLLGAAAVGWRRWWRAGHPWPGAGLGRQPRLLLAWTFGLLVCALALDAAHIRVMAVQALEEMLELNAGLALLMAVQAVYRDALAAGPADSLPRPATPI